MFQGIQLEVECFAFGSKGMPLCLMGLHQGLELDVVLLRKGRNEGADGLGQVQPFFLHIFFQVLAFQA